MKTRAYKPSDYNELCKWWKSYNWAPPLEDALPSSGIIVEGKCAGFLYITNSKMGIMEWIVGNPECSKEERTEAIDTVIKGIKAMAKGFGIKYIFSSVQHPNLIQKYEENGIMKTDEGMINFIGRID